MFEKEADYRKARKESKDRITKVIKVWSAEEETIHDEGFQKGAEFGYNKANKEIKLLKETHRQSLKILTDQIEELHKANEWHYVKDGDLPKEDLRPRTLEYYLTASKHKSYKGIVFEVAYFTGVIFTKGGDILDNVIAWKEIVLPELKESE